MSNYKQVPGQLYTFVSRVTGEKDAGVLPSKRGQSNEFAQWSKYHKGWKSKLFQTQSSTRYHRGQGPSGLISRMTHKLYGIKKWSIVRGYSPPLVSAEELLEIWSNQKDCCAACGGPLSLLECHIDHNHKTGEVRGFLHGHCNVAEGHCSSMSKEEFESFVEFVRQIKSKEST